MTFPGTYSQQIRRSNLPLAKLVTVCRDFPISWKRVLVKMCQKRAVDDDAVNELFTSKYGPSIRQLVSMQELRENLHSVMSSRVDTSILWMFLRTLPEPKEADESEEVRLSGFLKELGATRQFGMQQQFSYDSFLSPHAHLLPYRPPWHHLYRRILNRFTWGLNNKLKVLYPVVQRTKNVSQETGWLYTQEYPARTIYDVKTVDLEVHYGHTGRKIMGSCEMRSAWKFNDLKPRIYYCQGGRDYFASRYMKFIAIALMEAVPATGVERRSHPERYFQQDPDVDYLVTWDFESFTTRLSELKFFLHAISSGLRDMPVHPIRLLDYHLGLVEVHPSDLLDDYNETVNIASPFSTARLLDRFDLDPEFDLLTQCSSGMLGVAGNIGFSTALHGLHLCRICGDDNCVCVGDDALAAMEVDPMDQLIPEMSRLGNIHPEKFTVMMPGTDDPIAFTKRAVYRDVFNSLYRDFLWELPLSPYVDGEFGHRDIRIPANVDELEFRISRTAISVGSLLWHVLDHADELYGAEYDKLLFFLQRCYNYLDLPHHGWLPGYVYRRGKFHFKAHFALPSLECYGRKTYYDPRLLDWLEYLFDNCSQSEFEVPVQALDSQPVMPELGDIFTTGISRLWQFLEDMGYVKVTKMVELVGFLDFNNKRALRVAFKRLKTSGRVAAVIVECIQSIPDKYHELFRDPHYQESLHTISEHI